MYNGSKNLIIGVFLNAVFLIGCSESSGNEKEDADSLIEETVEEMISETTEEVIEEEQEIETLPAGEGTHRGDVITDPDEIFFNITELNDASVEYCFETSVTLMNEGPHCDLVDWKHGYTEWKSIDEIGEDGSFDLPEPPYGPNVRFPFPDVAIQELIEYTEEYCGDYWPEHISDIKSVYDYPADVSVSYTIYKIVGTDPETGFEVVLIYALERMMGC